MSTLKAFVVEDNAVIRESLVAALEELAPVEVVGTAEDERSAVEWLGRCGDAPACDLVIVDIFLKAGSGLGVLRAARERHRPMTMVVLSNYATADMQRRCLALGASRVFDKSSELDELIGYCEQLAGNGRDGQVLTSA
jgi:DNA-binding NarL/FixJ family response regulator